MPADSDFDELLDNCTFEWISFNGINGQKFTSNLNGRTIFIPAAGYYSGIILTLNGSRGDYWSSNYVDAVRARHFGINSEGVGPVNNNSRRYGFSIRPVYDPNT